MSANPDEYVVLAPSAFGAAIREFRRRQHLSQRELAERTDIHRSYLSSLETGATTAAIDQIVRALRALNLEIVVRERRAP